VPIIAVASRALALDLTAVLGWWLWAWLHYPHGVRQPGLRTFRQWMTTAIVAFTLMEFLEVVRPGPG
jgi:hypothetical protein